MSVIVIIRSGESADIQASFVRVEQAANSPSVIYYTHRSFGNLAATVNVGRPSTNYGAIYGVQARFQAYTAAMVVLGDSPAFPDTAGQMQPTPEGWIRRAP